MDESIQNRKVNLLIGCSGSSASMRMDTIIEAFAQTSNYNIKIILTKHSKIFLNDVIPDLKEFQKKNNVEFYFANEDFEFYKTDKSCPLFVKLSQWTDVFLLVALSANTLSKIAMGLCDNLLTHVVRAFDNNKMHFFHLSMNTLMYESPITKEYIKILTEGYKFIHIPPKETSKESYNDDDNICAVVDNKTLVEVIENIRDKVIEKKQLLPC